jgi:membrane-bound lytic murein transglycosylase D
MFGQTITVPNSIKLADMQLYINPEAKEEIQKKVTSLTRSPKHYKDVFDRINLYMPLIERILKEEGLPEDFKYLAIQESHLIADDISENNAVGFWQFKKDGASEVGVRIDRYIDERMHIVASTRGFARYVKKHHSHFKNWLYALLAFHLGRTGVKNFIKEKKWHIDDKKVTIDGNTHWYIYHFIAHKIVFKDAIGKELHPEICLYEYHDGQGKTIHEISQQFNVPLPMIKAYNKWLKPTKVPEDAACPIMIPMTHQQYAQADHLRIYNHLYKYKIDYNAYWDSAQKFPDIKVLKNQTKAFKLIQINGIIGTVAQANDNLVSLARKGNISIKQFLEFNDIDKDHRVAPGQVYYFKPKNNKAAVHYHIVRQKETWWNVAQKYGIKQPSLLSKNRVQKVTPLRTGRVLWLRFIRPANIPIAYLNKPELDNNPHKTEIKPLNMK